MKYIRIAFSFLIGVTIFALLAAFIEDGNFSFDFLSRLTTQDRAGVVFWGTLLSVLFASAVEFEIESNKKSK